MANRFHWATRKSIAGIYSKSGFSSFLNSCSSAFFPDRCAAAMVGNKVADARPHLISQHDKFPTSSGSEAGLCLSPPPKSPPAHNEWTSPPATTDLASLPPCKQSTPKPSIGVQPRTAHVVYLPEFVTYRPSNITAPSPRNCVARFPITTPLAPPSHLCRRAGEDVAPTYPDVQISRIHALSVLMDDRRVGQWGGVRGAR